MDNFDTRFDDPDADGIGGPDSVQKAVRVCAGRMVCCPGTGCGIKQPATNGACQGCGTSLEDA